ncbi:MAG TPA: peptide chain release factor 3 [Verrucomicrobiales bacterium]|nr:peptide chain release factor 3 [Akkermansiaceae bacterium]HRX56423.1 peptide chain release factor 3 [Verrucomicrobiales bacterium]
MSAPLPPEIARRRTFAIISHPDAGKTTLTEKFLLYGGAVQLAGSVTARKNQSATTSDWMDLEKQRGISVSSTVLQFEYRDCVINLLDTPGHKDFSEDTYRVLTAVDAAVMVIDAGKGIEAQTLKLFEVCRRRGVPIFTFMNKLDRPARPPIELLDELERVLGISSLPMNWPLGDGPEFKGVYDRETRQVHLFERVKHGSYRAPVNVSDIGDETVRKVVPEHVYKQVTEDLSLFEDVSTSFSLDDVRAGKLTPVFFGSAMNNFGVQLMLDRFISLAPPPAGRSSGDHFIEPDRPGFSGFVFKIQANMNPKHRDRVAFIRIVSGEFTRDMVVTNTRSGKPMRLSNSQRLFAQERETVDSAWAGDVVGIVGNHDFLIGDTLAEDPTIVFDEIPRFPPECFARLHNRNTAKFKRFRDGMDQLLKEGLAQSFEPVGSLQRVPVLGAVGPLQFEVLQYRMETEYGAECRLESAPWEEVRWIIEKNPPPPEPGNRHREVVIPEMLLPQSATLTKDARGNWAVLFPDKYSAAYFEQKNEDRFEVFRQPL